MYTLFGRNLRKLVFDKNRNHSLKVNYHLLLVRMSDRVAETFDRIFQLILLKILAEYKFHFYRKLTKYVPSAHSSSPRNATA